MEDFGGIVGIIVSLAIFLFFIVCAWRIFEKAGVAGFWSIVPIVNAYFLIKIAGKEWWWLILLLIPFVNFIAVILIWHGVSTNFGKGALFTVGLILLSFIFIPLLAFGDAEYQKSKNYAF